MNLTVDKSVFLKALSHGQSVVEKRTTIPILSHVLLQAHDDHVKLTSTDMELALIETIPATVLQGGGTTVSAICFLILFENYLKALFISILTLKPDKF